jgi:RNA polymerase sigma-70 factor (ECF subfamily)
MGRTEETKISAEELVDNYGDLVSAICFRMIKDPKLAEEAAQEVWYEVLNSLDTFRGEAKISTWIYTIAYRVVINYSANEKTYDINFLKECFDGEDLKVPDKVNYDRKLWVKEKCDKCLTGVLHCLNNQKRLAYLFRDVVQLSYKIISEILGKKETAVRKMVSRSRKKLKHFLNDECVLYNPEGSCNCRLKKLITDIDLQQEYKRIRDLKEEANFYLASEKVMPRKNYWKKYL